MTEARNQIPGSRPPLAYQKWFAEMKRRKVFRVIAAYGAVAFVILEAASIVFPAIPLPAWTMSLVVWMAILGLPIAVVLAWAFEMTPEGVRRTEDAAQDEIGLIVSAPARARWPSGLLALGGIVLLGIGFYGGRRSSMRSSREVQPPPAAQAGEPGPTSTALDADRRPAIAVLSFSDMSPEQDQEYFSDGVSEEILQALSKVRDLRVAARSSAFTYKGRDMDPRQIGQELGVLYLLDGSVRKDGDQIRISAELVNASDGFSLWSETYDRRLQNVFEIQREIAEAIAEELRVPLGLSREALVACNT